MLPRHVFLPVPLQLPSVDIVPAFAAQVPKVDWQPASQCEVEVPQKPPEEQQSVWRSQFEIIT